ncbi:DUF3047 domain-containing protein [Alkalilimnicola sp. S0819]|uniref:DUF3047 domain-containing protein n=1 Tax=Alkalilimnicola sp. S0819 TaxID=2613922 RepID=UPI001D00DA1B|nr:DUF3047 domain-containing protein [Alkalilimnicola sp. S0819]
MRPGLFSSIPLLLLLASATAAEIPAFSRTGLSGWEERSFEGNSRYRLEEQNGRQVLHASCDGTASVLYREQEVDLRETPILRWRWRVDEVFQGNDERSKAGDDYAARVYVVVDGGLLPWRTLAVNYVWAGGEPRGQAWPNAFTGNAMMLALRSGERDTGAWREERRDVREDFRRLHEREIDVIDGVALMTDCDNTGGQAEAWFGDIRFEAR